jgi:cytidylate kinase
MIITLSRQMGSGGDIIARQVATALGLTLIGRDTIRAAAAAAGVPAELLQRLMYEEAPPSLAAEVLESLGSVPRQMGGVGTPAPNPLGTVFAPFLVPASVNLEEGARAVGAIIAAVADPGNVLILGQGSQLWLQARPAALHVQIVAPLELRISRVAERDQLTWNAAQRRVRASDAARADYLARYHAANWLDPLLYHLVINTGLLSLTEATAVIVDAARGRET